MTRRFGSSGVRTLVDAGLVDREWIQAQLGRGFRSDGAAARACLRDPECSPHPLFVGAFVNRNDGGPEAAVHPALWYLDDPIVHRKHAPHPLVDVRALAARGVGDGAPLAALARELDADTELPVPAGAPAATWRAVREASFAALAAVRGGRPLGPERIATEAGLVLVARPPVRPVLQTVHAAGAASLDLTVASPPDEEWRRVLVALSLALTGGRFLPVTDTDPVSALSAGIDESRAGRVVLSLGAPVLPEQVDALVAGLDDQAAAAIQPLLLAPSESVASAGAVFDDAVPVPLLSDHSPRDAAGLDRMPVPAAYGDVLAVRRSSDLVLEPSLGPLALTDLSLRLAAHGGAVVLDPQVVVHRSRAQEAGPRQMAAFTARHPAPPDGSEAAWRAAGFTRDGRGALAPALAVVEGSPSLRWTIDLASPPGELGEIWGDTHFGRSLAAALERLGQHVAVDRRSQRQRRTRDLDDVLLVVHGPDAVPAREGLVNLLWVISDPHLVTEDEVAGYQRVYAASLTWSERMSTAWGRPVEPLLQCTDPALFHPGRADSQTCEDVLFVGNTRGEFREVVRLALATGAELAIHGAGWESLVPPRMHRSRWVENADLGRLYASAGIVLADHWPTMRDEGFLANRLFDAAACGARIISDDVPGMAETFGDQVRVYRDGTELARLLHERPFPSTEVLAERAATVAREHSFDARAQRLLDDVLRVGVVR